MNGRETVASYKPITNWFRYRIRALLLLMLLVAIVGTVWQYRNHGTVLVPKRDILLGEPLSPQDVTHERWPIKKIPVGAATQLTELGGQLAVSRLYSGEAILRVKLCPPDRFASPLV
jgi:Flp pilus assembly protein CpaB